MNENFVKNILITGASGGMGAAATEHFAAAGYRVFALDVKEIGAREGIIPVSADVTSEESVKEAFSLVKESCDGLFAIIHFAGIYMLDSLVEMSTESFRRIFDINLHGVFFINKTFRPLLSRGSRIIITTSELAPLDPLPFTGVYAVSKAALDKYAYSLKMELQLLGIEVSALRAGAVDTGMLGASTDALDRFTEKTELYSCNARRFKDIVNRVEARCISSKKIAMKTEKILRKSKPKFAYSINRNPLLLMLNLLPKRAQFWIIKKILK